VAVALSLAAVPVITRIAQRWRAGERALNAALEPARSSYGVAQDSRREELVGSSA
jgi:hypothetical protein